MGVITACRLHLAVVRSVGWDASERVHHGWFTVGCPHDDRDSGIMCSRQLDFVRPRQRIVFGTFWRGSPRVEEDSLVQDKTDNGATQTQGGSDGAVGGGGGGS